MSSITSGGVAGLAEALPKASQSNWAHLNLTYVEMGDDGIAALATLVSQGRLEQLEELSLSDGGGVTNEGMILLAQAISVGGLPVLKSFKMVCFDKEKIRLLGVGAVAHAVVNGCPKLRVIYLTKPISDEEVTEPVHEMIEGMVHRAGQDGDVRV